MTAPARYTGGRRATGMRVKYVTTAFLPIGTGIMFMSVQILHIYEILANLLRNLKGIVSRDFKGLQISGVRGHVWRSAFTVAVKDLFYLTNK